jgi:hypothetical protein
MRRNEVGVLAQGVDCAPRVLQLADAGQHVDDRLRRDSRYRGRTDVVNAAVEPATEDALEQRSLRVESARPLRVIGDEGDALRHGPDATA